MNAFHAGPEDPRRPADYSGKIVVRAQTLSQWIEKNPQSVEAVLFDIDGTLVRGGEALPGAIGLIERLDRAEIPYLLLTNDANHSHEEKAASLADAGLGIPPTHIISSGDVIAEVVAERHLAGQLFFIMGNLGTPSYAAAAGLRVTRDLGELGACRGVIVGEENYHWEDTFNAVINFFIANRTALFLVPNPDSYWPDSRGGIAIGAGGKARFICSILDDYGVHIEPLFLGKPYRAVFTFAREVLERLYGRRIAQTHRVLMVGDSLSGDIRGANGAGHTSVLVLTGITTEAMLSNGELAAEVIPDVVVQGL